jgi:phosphate transport system ATP-binding protein
MTLYVETTKTTKDRAVGASTPEPERAASAPVQRPALAIDQLNAYYGSVLAVQDVALPIARCSTTAIIGPSGCGKSTVLRCLNRMHEVVPRARVSGRVLLEGQNIYDPGVDPVRVRRRIGMLFQRPNPFPTMSIFDNVVAGLKLIERHRRRELEEIVERSLRQVALWQEVKDVLGKSAANLSGGQQQRLCLARCLAVRPEVILMDEPCSALDPIATLRIEDLIRELEEHYTIVIVTHNMQQAARVADRVAFFMINERGAGELVEYGSAEQIFTRPREKRTEDYVTGRFG